MGAQHALYSVWRTLGSVALPCRLQTSLGMRSCLAYIDLRANPFRGASSTLTLAAAAEPWSIPHSLSSVREYAKRSHNLSLRKPNQAASRAAVLPFLEQPSTQIGEVKPLGPIVDTAIPPLPVVPEPVHYQRIGHITGPFSITPQLAFAVVQLGPKQFKVTADDIIFVDKLKDVDINDVLRLNKVLLTGTQTETVIGRPYLPDTFVVAAVEEHFKDAKVHVFKKKKRKRYSKLKGHRSHITALRILEVQQPHTAAAGAAAAVLAGGQGGDAAGIS